MDVVRTPDERFAELPGYGYPPCYVEVGSKSTGPLRMHYVEAGPPDADPVLLLHGQPTWSYLYRTVIETLAAAGHWVLAPDLIGFGRSDKPVNRFDYTVERHVEWREYVRAKPRADRLGRDRAQVSLTDTRRGRFQVRGATQEKKFTVEQPRPRPGMQERRDHGFGGLLIRSHHRV